MRPTVPARQNCSAAARQAGTGHASVRQSAARRWVSGLLVLAVTLSWVVPPLAASIAPASAAPSTSLAPGWKSIESGHGNNVAIKTDGTLWAWGNNYNGDLGIGSSRNETSTPIQVGEDTDWGSVYAGLGHNFAIKNDGTLWAWGGNYRGQLGLGDTADRTTPVQVGSAADWESVSSGAYFTVAIKKDGTLWAWGSNDVGQLGLGSTPSALTPTQVGTNSDWAQVSSGTAHTIALRDDGTVWAWGFNRYGQLGIGSTDQMSTPTQVSVGTSSGWKSIATGEYHSILLGNDGTLWLWGENKDGRLGLGDTNNRTVPTQLGDRTDWASVSGGGFSTYATRTDGTLWAWGYNAQGQLGNGETTDSTVPVEVPTPSATSGEWTSVHGGDFHALGTLSDGSLYAWGSSWYGELGPRSIQWEDSPTPIQVFGPYAPPADVPVAPVKIRITKVTRVVWAPPKVKVSWTAATGAAGYEVLRSTSSTGRFTVVGKTSSRSMALSVPSRTGIYWYKVRPYQVVDGKVTYGRLSSPRRAPRTR